MWANKILILIKEKNIEHNQFYLIQTSKFGVFELQGCIKHIGIHVLSSNIEGATSTAQPWLVALGELRGATE